VPASAVAGSKVDIAWVRPQLRERLDHRRQARRARHRLSELFRRQVGKSPARHADRARPVRSALRPRGEARARPRADQRGRRNRHAPGSGQRRGGSKARRCVDGPG
jgi:hypothetical protein